jgi:hypothetical protein
MPVRVDRARFDRVVEATEPKPAHGLSGRVPEACLRQ